MPRVSYSTRWRLLRGILAEPHLRLMYVVVGLWAATDVAFFLAVSVVAHDRGGSAAVGLVGAVRVLPGALGMGLVAFVADRASRPLLVAVVNVVMAVLCVALAASVHAGAGLLPLVVLQGLGSIAAAFLKPSLQGLLPRLVPLPAQLVQAGAVWSLVNGVGSVLGPGLGGALLAVRGPVHLYLALAAVYALTAVVAGVIRTTYQPAREHHLAEPGVLAWSPLRGLRLFAAPGTRTMFLLSLLQRALSGLVGASLVLVAFEVAGTDGERTSGALLAALGAGGLVGAAIALLADGHHTRWWFAAGLALYGLPLVLLGASHDVTVAAAALALSGVGAAWAGIYGSGLINRLLPDHVAGRGWGTLLAFGAGATALGSLASPVVAHVFGLTSGLVVAGVLAGLTVLAGVPGLRTLAHRTVPPADTLALLRGADVLATLPGLCLERLSVAASRWAVEPGEVVVREGDHAHQFFVVADGELDVLVGSAVVRRLGRGDHFGEVALLRDVPRTATVVSVGPSVLVALERDVFVSTVTGHRPTEAFADGAVTGLLARDDRRPSS
ncbi:MAG: cyclic nucleotide-binding domain-containing protein [Nocardioides sp.]